jgi:large subunit ribosomal protein L29
MPKTSEHRAELRRLSDSELLGRLGEARRELFNLRFQLATGQLDNSARIGAVKKDVARLSTFLREREIAAAEALEESTQS